MTANSKENELLGQLMPLATIRTLTTSKETPFSSDLDYYQILEAKVLLQVYVSRHCMHQLVSHDLRVLLKRILCIAGQANANALQP
jgi:hypothetical protein